MEIITINKGGINSISNTKNANSKVYLNFSEANTLILKPYNLIINNINGNFCDVLITCMKNKKVFTQKKVNIK